VLLKVFGVIAAAAFVVVGVFVAGLGVVLAPGRAGDSCSSDTYGWIQLEIALAVGAACIASSALLVRQLAYGRGTQPVVVAVAHSVCLLLIWVIAGSEFCP
jgi:hypothetical protein